MTALHLGIAGTAAFSTLWLVRGWFRFRRGRSPWWLVAAWTVPLLGAAIDLLSPGVASIPLAASLGGLLVAVLAETRWAGLRERRGLEQTLHQLKSHLEGIEAALDQAREERELVTRQLDHKEHLAVVGELAAAIAHEVRNPLAVIVNAVASLRRAGLDETDRQMLLSIVDEEAARLNRLVTDLLRFARPVKLIRAPVSIDELAEHARCRLGDRHGLVVEIPGPGAAEPLSADASLLRVGIENLVENACQAMPDGGTVRLRARTEEFEGRQSVFLQVIDEGTGMPPEVRERATAPFFTTRPSGTGLGLAIVARIVRAHQGRLTIDSIPGQGTTVTLILPHQNEKGVSPDIGPPPPSGERAA